MMKIFGKKTRNTKGIVEAQYADSDAQATSADSPSSASATFSNPFGLGQKDSSARPVVEDDGGPLREGDEGLEENGAADARAVLETVAARVTQDDQDEDREEFPVETEEPLAQAEQPETIADMQNNSSDRPYNPLSAIWTDPPGETPAEEPDRGPEPSLRAEPLAGREDQGWNGEAGEDMPAAREEAPLIRMPEPEAPAPARLGPASADPEPLVCDDEPRRPSLEASAADGQAAAAQADTAASQESRPRLSEPEAEMPRFSPVSSGSGQRDQAALGARGTAAQTKLWEAFTPSRPKYSSRFFAGRRWALQRVITAVEQDQAHIVIYGPRGIGKTSLANVLAESASEVEYQVLRYPCGSNATFEEIFRGLLSSLPADNLDRATQARFSGAENLAQLLPEGEFGPTDLTEILSQIKLDHAILIIDEFDRAQDMRLKNQLAEAIKNLSDASARVTFIVIGIAHSLDELIGMHPSIQRHLVGIHLPLMTTTELERVVQAGEDASGIRFEEATRDMVVAFSKGLPYFAQLLSLHAGRAALKRGSMLVQMVDLREALEMVLLESDPLARASYDAATQDETNQLLIDVLFAAATAPFDDYGTFTVENAAEMFVDDEGKKLPKAKIQKCLEDLAQQENGRLIETWPMPASETRYAFILQTMRQYILLRQAVRRGLM